ncbi:hypothetical protein C9374_004977 [Naegleria lovaniensis]|uniref:ABC transporter domain-containing protein n=1 Tax=Naegleria lovaniensis TaxID=51637 RepID=A0AA88GRZ9_NAELO|nr:uncharacterized protein C9374_004977 [Naegleria lovaniensis]KAG2383010.1 hypothetical protein C9374_004977 [Naegleria lovaniensis]
MGPSGSGKSTLLAALSDHAHYANVYGDIKINGVKASMKQFKNVCAFVTQDDFMNRQLTVEEAILFSARTRLNWSVSQKRLERLVDGVIQLLDLNEVRHSIIGDENKRGISGGQRKRVSIAMEFVACPYVLFLDEPTSSLDSYSSFEVAKSMKDIARSGITVVAVVHQPRYEIFQMFDDVILLGKGGRVAYAGPCSTAMDYFKNELQLECPPFVNPSDFFLDAIYDPQAAYRAQTERNSTTSSSQRKSTEFRGLTCDEIFQKWEMYQSKNSSALHRNDDTSSHLSDNHSSSLNGHTESSYDILVKEEENRKQSALLHFIVCLYRSFSLKIRDIMSFFIDSLMVYISGLALGIIFLKETYTGPMPSELIQSCPVAIRSICEYPLNNPLINVASIVPLALGLCASMSSLSTFGTRQEQLVFKKERSSGLSTIAYFLAKNLEQLPNIVLGPLIFLSIFLCLYAPRASFGEYYYIILLMQFSAFGLGSLISVSIRMDLSQLASAVSVLVFQLVGGSKPTLPQMKSIFVPMYWFSCISYIRYCQEALYLVEIKYYKDTYDIKSSLELFGYDLDNFNFCVGMIPVFGIVFRILTLIMLYQRTYLLAPYTLHFSAVCNGT